MSKKEENEKIRLSLISVFTKIGSPHTLSVGHESLKKIIIENETSESKLNFILSQISEQINSFKKGEKKESIKLLSIVCIAIKDISPYLSRILTILQSNIIDDNASIFTTIASTYGEIVENSTNNSSDMISSESNSSSNFNKTLKTVYELLQGFCIYNMKQESKANQICGSLCLTSLIETCPMILQPAYMKYIWENIIFFIDKPNYNAKSELLNSLISLIFASENIFKPFSTVTLYKILDFLTDNDWFRRKLALNVIYTLIIYCQEEIMPLKGHIVEFLRVLKSDKVKEVREVCMQTLKIFNEVVSEEDAEVEKPVDNRVIEKTKKGNNNLKELSPIRPIFENNVKNVDKADKADKAVDKKSQTPKRNNNSNSNAFTDINKKSAGNLTGNINKVIPRSSTSNNIKRDKVNKTNIETEDNLMNLSGIGFKSSSNVTSRSKKGKNEEPTNSIGTVNNARRAVTPTRNRSSNNNNNNRDKDKDSINLNLNINDLSQDNTEHNTSKRDLKVNRKDDNSFVNAKMVLKRDPSYSIFKTGANQEFFSNAPKENGEIQVVFKEKEVNKEKEAKSSKNNKESVTDKNQTEEDDEENYVNYVKMNPKRNIEMPLQMSTERDAGANNILKASYNGSNFMENSKHEVDLKNDSFMDKDESVANEKGNKKQNSSYNASPSKTERNTGSKQSNSIELSDIIKQMKILSDKQIFLLDTIEKTQESSQDQFTNMNNRIQNLEKTVHQLVTFIKSSGLQMGNTSNSMNNFNNNYSTNTSTGGMNSSKYESNSINKEDFDSFGNNMKLNLGIGGKKTTNQNTNHNAWTEILLELKNKNPTSAFNIANNSEEVNLIKLIDKIKVTQIKDVDQNTMEETISKLTTLITRGQYILVIISFFKNLLVTLEYSLKIAIYQNIKDILLYTSSNRQQFNISNEEMIDINLLLSVVNGKLNKSNNYGGISNLISSFANSNN